jgi:hypothetical protein
MSKPKLPMVLERLIAEGRVVPALLDLAKLGMPPELPCEMSSSEALAAQRGEVDPNERRQMNSWSPED